MTLHSNVTPGAPLPAPGAGGGVEPAAAPPSPAVLLAVAQEITEAAVDLGAQTYRVAVEMDPWRVQLGPSVELQVTDGCETVDRIAHHLGLDPESEDDHGMHFYARRGIVGPGVPVKILGQRDRMHRPCQCSDCTGARA